MGEVNGKLTGAVFLGEGHLHLTPPNPQERHNLLLLTKSEEFDEDFDQAVLRFTDSTAAELRQAASGKGQPDTAFGSVAMEVNTFLRLKLNQNLHLRLLEDVLSPSLGGYFTAILRGKKTPHLIFTIDPHGAPEVAPEEVSLLAWNDWGPSFPAAFHLAAESASGAEQNETYRIDHEDLDVTIEKSGFLSGLATVHVLALRDGLAVVPLRLHDTLRVSNVETDRADPLDFVQEKKDEDADFGVLLAKPLAKGDSTTLRITYGGKDVVRNEGNANYYPIARESWYPNGVHHLGNYATYHMLFHVPKGLTLIATGTRLSEKTEGKIATSEWKTEVPLPVVGFNLGEFTMKEAQLASASGLKLTVDAYANTNPPDNLANLGASSDLPGASHTSIASAIGTISTVSMLGVQLSQGQAAAQIYSNLYGPLPFDHIALTQQYACNYGQSWPMLVYLPVCGFLDSTQQHFLGLRPEDMYWKTVTAHEVAHQWWGQTVGFLGYRDQWMSEGFADASAAIFLQETRPKMDEFREFWREQRRSLTEKNTQGFRPIDVGPVTMGFRLNSVKTGWGVYRNLVYPKGAYILHMLRMMMWSSKEGDARFSAAMRDFLSAHKLQPATTEDFKAAMERHMTPGMDLEGNHRLDWFFREYVYGTDLPVYHFESQLTSEAQGQTLHFKLTQSSVPDNFHALVPLYLELADGRVLRLGQINMTGSATIERTVPLPKTGSPAKRAMINYFYDLLALEN
jgi:hypothetical protein